MHALTVCLVLLALVCCASLIGRVVKVPLPFLQIAAGVVVALPPLYFRAPLDPPTFLLLFIPPLLFGDGWSISRREMIALRWSVLGHAVGLVLLTVLVGGYALHWLIPSMPIAVCFAVAAVVSPTDAVALSAITEHMRVPRRMKHILESEALLNDASGLVAMRIAVAAALTGAFSLGSAVGSFFLVAGAGLAIGWGLTLAYGRLHRVILGRAEDATVQTLLGGLLPFAAYGLAEHVGASGVLAAVAAGLAASKINLLEGAHLSARMQAGFAWGIITFTLNGVMFVMLGLQLPDILGHGPVGIDLITSDFTLPILGEILLLTGLLIVLRFAWVLGSMILGRMTGHHEQGSWRVILATSLAGVRGAVTLAAVLSLPFVLPDGTPFPARDLAVTLATGVILFTLVLAAAGLPLLLRRVHADDASLREEEQRARIAALEAGIAALGASEQAAGPHGTAIIEAYRERVLVTGDDGTQAEDHAWRELHAVALRAERKAVHDLRNAGKLEDTTARRMLGELDLVEAALTHARARPAIRDGSARLDERRAFEGS